MKILTYLGFDVGTKRSGVAIANSLSHRAHGIATIYHHKNGDINWLAIDALVAQYQIDAFVVGMPIDEKRRSSAMIKKVRDFGRDLSQHYHQPVYYVDEYFTTVEAKKQLKWWYLHPNAERGALDKRAAQVILQTWLDEQLS